MARGAARPCEAGPGRGPGRGAWPAWTAPSQTSLPYQEMAEEEAGTKAEGLAGAAALGAWLTVSIGPPGWRAPGRGACPQARGAASAQPSEVVNCIGSLLRNKLLIRSLVFSYCSVH